MARTHTKNAKSTYKLRLHILNNGGQKFFISYLLCVWSAQICSPRLDLFLTERFFLSILFRVPMGHGKSWKSSGHGKVMEKSWNLNGHGKVMEFLKINILRTFCSLFCSHLLKHPYLVDTLMSTNLQKFEETILLAYFKFVFRFELSLTVIVKNLSQPVKF